MGIGSAACSPLRGICVERRGGVSEEPNSVSRRRPATRHVFACVAQLVRVVSVGANALTLGQASGSRREKIARFIGTMKSGSWPFALTTNSAVRVTQIPRSSFKGLTGQWSAVNDNTGMVSLTRG